MPAVPRRLDAGHLHAEADAEEGAPALAGEMDGGDLALAAALAEAAGDEDAVHRLELRGDLGLGMLEQLGVEPVDVDLDPVGEAAVDQRLGQALIGVGRPTYLPTTPIVTSPSGLNSRSVTSSQRAISGSARPRAEGAEHLRVEPRLAMILGRHRIDARRVERGMTASVRTLQNKAILARSLCGQRPVAAADDDLGLDAEAGQLADAVLGRLGLQLAGGGDVGDQGGVDRDGPRRPRRPCRARCGTGGSPR